MAGAFGSGGGRDHRVGGYPTPFGSGVNLTPVRTMVELVEERALEDSKLRAKIERARKLLLKVEPAEAKKLRKEVKKEEKGLKKKRLDDDIEMNVDFRVTEVASRFVE